MAIFNWRPKSATPPLEDVSDRFVAYTAGVLAELAASAGQDARRRDYQSEAALEARNLVLGVMLADGRLAATEVEGLRVAFLDHFPNLAAFHLVEQSTRDTMFLDDARAAVAGPTEMFTLLADADASRGSRHSWGYYELAMELAHATAGLDSHTSHAELEVLERMRHGMLDALDRAGVRPKPRVAVPALSAGGQESADDAGKADHEARVDEEPVEQRSLEEVLADLDALVGLDGVKAEVEQLADVLYIDAIREERGLPVARRSLHLVFTGNPGTGKTTVGRLVAEIYRALGALPKGHLVETDRGGLVAGYVGQTAERTKAVFEQARGGVLLIDEAYALARTDDGRDFGREAIDTLVKLMEDHRHDTAVIVAGYPAEMAHMIASNPGLDSRFPTTIYFPDYTDDELVAIFEIFCAKHHYKPDRPALARLRECLAAQPRDRGFGNARLVRNLFEEAVARQASRLRRLKQPPTEAQLVRLTKSDIPDPSSLDG